MLRKKERNEMIESIYNRFVTHEDPKSLLTWFVEIKPNTRMIFSIHQQPKRWLLIKQNSRPSTQDPRRRLNKQRWEEKSDLPRLWIKSRRKPKLLPIILEYLSVIFPVNKDQILHQSGPERSIKDEADPEALQQGKG
jgi:hypothetical protein